MTLQIIYTPETNPYKLMDFQTCKLNRHPGDPQLEALRSTYQRLKLSVPNLPNKVGIVTYPDEFNDASRKLLEEIEKPQSTYQPLELLDKALKLKDEDLTNPIAREYVDRALCVLIEHPALVMSPGIRSRKKFFTLSALASSQKIASMLRELDKQVVEKTSESSYHQIIDTALGEISRAYADFRDVEDMHAYVLERFNANKVSRNFPLYFLPEDYQLPFIYSVSLENKIETPDFAVGVLETINLGCKALGYPRIPEEVQREIDSWNIDKFGETINVNSIEKLLSSLPQPKTIITDTYIVDCFPQLAKIGFESFEFR